MAYSSWEDLLSTKAASLQTLFLDGDDRRDQGSKDDCREMRLKRKKSHTDSNRRPTFATTTIAVESSGKAGI